MVWFDKGGATMHVSSVHVQQEAEDEEYFLVRCGCVTKEREVMERYI